MESQKLNKFSFILFEFILNLISQFHMLFGEYYNTLNTIAFASVNPVDKVFLFSFLFFVLSIRLEVRVYMLIIGILLNSTIKTGEGHRCSDALSRVE